eukprot:768612-Hanusia_phi.AAC.7
MADSDGDGWVNYAGWLLHFCQTVASVLSSKVCRFSESIGRRSIDYAIICQRAELTFKECGQRDEVERRIGRVQECRKQRWAGGGDQNGADNDFARRSGLTMMVFKGVEGKRALSMLIE